MENPQVKDLFCRLPLGGIWPGQMAWPGRVVPGDPSGVQRDAVIEPAPVDKLLHPRPHDLRRVALVDEHGAGRWSEPSVEGVAGGQHLVDRDVAALHEPGRIQMRFSMAARISGRSVSATCS